MSFPRDEQSIDPAWLSAALHLPVLSFDKKPCSVGQLSSVIILQNISYGSSDHSGKSSYVVKIHAATEKTRELAISVRAYEREIYFYQHLQKTIPLRTPTIFGIWSDLPNFFIILMEDLSLEWAAFPAFAALGPDHIIPVSSDLAKFFSWSSKLDLSVEKLRHPRGPAGDYAQFMENTKNTVPQMIERFKTTNRYSQYPGLEAWALFWKNLNETGKALQLFETIQKILSSRPQFLCHGDLNVNNIWWKEDKTDPSNSRKSYQYIFFDFQIIRSGPIGLDLVAFFCACPLEEISRGAEIKIIEHILNEAQKMSKLTLPSIKATLDDVLLHSLVFTSCFMEFLIKVDGDAPLPNGFLVTLDLFTRYDVPTLVDQVLAGTYSTN
jgi:hypothetical protein